MDELSATGYLYETLLNMLLSWGDVDAAVSAGRSVEENFIVLTAHFADKLTCAVLPKLYVVDCSLLTGLEGEKLTRLQKMNAVRIQLLPPLCLALLMQCR